MGELTNATVELRSEDEPFSTSAILNISGPFVGGEIILTFGELTIRVKYDRLMEALERVKP